MTPTRQAFNYHLEKWVTARSDEERDISSFCKVAANHLKSKPNTSEIAPCLAVIYVRFMEYENNPRLSTFVRRIFVGVLIWLLEHCIYRGRPMWNDFRMALWVLSRNPRYIRGLHRHLLKAMHGKNEAQFFSGEWMVNSVCQQDPEFKELWDRFCITHGSIFG